jgi:hypothetical protein
MDIYGFVGKPETAKKTRVTNTFSSTTGLLKVLT